MVLAFIRGRGKKSPFQKKNTVELKKFDGGLNNQVSPYLIEDNELADIQNYHYEERGTLTKRMGYTARYGSTFDAAGCRGGYNYRLDSGASFLLAAAGTSVYYEAQNFQEIFDTKAEWDTGTFDVVVSDDTPGDIVLADQSGYLAEIILAEESAILGGNAGSRSGSWTSPAIDISSVTDKTTGVIVEASNVPANTTRVWQTRTATTSNMVTGVTAWVGLGVGNTIDSAGNNYLQVRVLFTSTVEANPSVQSLEIQYDLAPAMTALLTGMDGVARYNFATMNDIIYIVNGVNTNREWTGTGAATTQGGSPPIAKYVFVHKNRMFLAGNTTNPSRLYFSNLGDGEIWDVLDFIDVGKGDGDVITALFTLLDTLIIFKTNSIWMLSGSTSADFILRMITNEAGCASQKSISSVRNNTIAHLATDGIRVFDGLKTATVSDRITGTFEGLNLTKLSVAESVEFDHHYYLAVPEGAAVTNDCVLVFDLVRAAWTVYRGMNVGFWVVWRRYNRDFLVFGDSDVGQVYEYPSGFSDDGTAISSYFVTKQVFGEDQETVHLLRQTFVSCRETSNLTPTSLTIRYRANNGSDSSPATLTLTTGLNVRRAIPSIVSVSTVRTVGIKIENNELDRQVSVYGISIEWVPKGRRETT